MNDLLQADTKTEKLYKLVKQQIISAILKPGEKIVVAHLAKKYGVSVIPVREALSRLQAEGYLEIIPHTGTYVKGLEIDYLKQVYPIRGLLEGFATRLSCPRLSQSDITKLYNILDKLDDIISGNQLEKYADLNQKFHTFIYRKSQNDYLEQTILELHEKTQRVRTTYDLMPQRAVISNNEHREILHLLEEGKANEAEQAIQQHILGTLKTLLAMGKEN